MEHLPRGSVNLDRPKIINVQNYRFAFLINPVDTSDFVSFSFIVTTHNMNVLHLISYCLRLFVSTWNVGGESPPSNLNLDEWLHSSPSADIYVLGYEL